MPLPHIYFNHAEDVHSFMRALIAKGLVKTLDSKEPALNASTETIVTEVKELTQLFIVDTKGHTYLWQDIQNMSDEEARDSPLRFTARKDEKICSEFSLLEIKQANFDSSTLICNKALAEGLKPIDLNSSTLKLPEFICSITREETFFPVITPDQQTYEDSSLKMHLSVNSLDPTDPLTRRPLTLAHLYPNQALRSLINVRFKETLSHCDLLQKQLSETIEADGRSLLTCAEEYFKKIFIEKRARQQLREGNLNAFKKYSFDKIIAHDKETVKVKRTLQRLIERRSLGKNEAAIDKRINSTQLYLTALEDLKEGKSTCEEKYFPVRLYALKKMYDLHKNSSEEKHIKIATIKKYSAILEKTNTANDLVESKETTKKSLEEIKKSLSDSKNKFEANFKENKKSREDFFEKHPELQNLSVGEIDHRLEKTRKDLESIELKSLGRTGLVVLTIVLLLLSVSAGIVLIATGAALIVGIVLLATSPLWAVSLGFAFKWFSSLILAPQIFEELKEAKTHLNNQKNEATFENSGRLELDTQIKAVDAQLEEIEAIDHPIQMPADNTSLLEIPSQNETKSLRSSFGTSPTSGISSSSMWNTSQPQKKAHEEPETHDERAPLIPKT